MRELAPYPPTRGGAAVSVAVQANEGELETIVVTRNRDNAKLLREALQT